MQVQARTFSAAHDGQVVPLQLAAQTSFDRFGETPHRLSPSQIAARDLCLRFTARMVAAAPALGPVLPDRRLGVLLAGKPGVGKTHLAESVVRHYLAHTAPITPLTEMRHAPTLTDDGRQALERAREYLLSLSIPDTSGVSDPPRSFVDLGGLKRSLSVADNHLNLVLALLSPPAVVQATVPTLHAKYSDTYGWMPQSTGIRVFCGVNKKWGTADRLSRHPSSDRGDFLKRFELDAVVALVREKLPEAFEVLYGAEQVGREVLSPESTVPVRSLDISAYLANGKDQVGFVQMLTTAAQIFLDLGINFHAFGSSILVRDLKWKSDASGIIFINAASAQALVNGAAFLSTDTRQGGLLIVDDLFAPEISGGVPIEDASLDAFKTLVSAAHDRGIRLLMTSNIDPNDLLARLDQRIKDRWQRVVTHVVEGESGRSKGEGF